MTTAAYQKARRDRARAAGLCTTCLKRTAIPGKSKCDPCNEYHGVRSTPYVSTGQHVKPERFCTSCQMHGGGHRNDCREQRSAA
ncbi:MAG: hypothetical protein H0X39_13625 [Actinobacteria bacterium]|nr:hypothetical protein [Actinomycetota bacterium]